ncbi:MAG: phosphoenolpyruvate--protein phosphotransferase [Planctomycetes bacterium]|nr:phosphoenolpyruvate--protein phosphotransferase [Planctomycetota bacterium]
MNDATDLRRAVKGLGISPGVALGPVWYFKNEIGELPRRTLAPEAIAPEVARLRDAFREAAEEFRRQRDANGAALPEHERRIFDSHLAFYEDELLKGSIAARIEKQALNAEAALADEVAHLASLFATMDRLFAERAADVRDVGNRVQRVLVRRQQEALAGTQPVILCARELLPSDTLTLDRSRLLGIVTEVGGEASHVAILARASGIPAVSGVKKLEALLPPGGELGIDGRRGRLWIAPPPRLRGALQRSRDHFVASRRRLVERSVAAVSRDRDLSLLLNIENFDSLDPALLRSADGVGLYRTEFLFMGRSTFPSEEEQLAFYKDVLAHVGGREVTFRTIDVGGDKPLPYLVTPREQNPALGWRGIRLTFEWLDLLIPQLRALLRAAAHGPLKILLPMVTTVEEVTRARALLAELIDDLRRQGLPHDPRTPLGAMLEVPAAALAADRMAREADFLSVGTNDLLQYLFAVDRNNLQVAGLYQPLHPVALRLLRQVIAAGAAAGKPVTVCGEMAGEPLGTLALLGLGLKRFSMSPVHLPEARAIFRHFTAAEAGALVGGLLDLDAAADVEALLRAAAAERCGQETLSIFPR